MDGQKVYCGVDRCAWDIGVDDPCFHVDLYSEAVIGPSGVSVILDRDLLDIIVQENLHDVIWVSSCPEPSFQPNFLGVDLVTPCGSALAQGIFKRPDLFMEFIPVLNSYGLLPNEAGLILDYCARYLSLQNSTADLETFWSLGLDNVIFVYSDSKQKPAMS